jgi:hypothetical protein
MRNILFYFLSVYITFINAFPMRSHTNRNQKSTLNKNSTSALCAGQEVLSIDSAGKKITLKPGASLDQLPPTGAQQFLFQVIVDLGI